MQLFADQTLRDHLPTGRIVPWETEKGDNIVLARWGTAPDQQRTIIAMERAITPGIALEILGNDLTSLSVPAIMRYAEALRFQGAWRGPMHLMVTRLPRAIIKRATRDSIATAGLVSSEEALLVALIIQHVHGRYVAKAQNGFIEKSDPFGWYSCLAQTALPHYLPLFSRIVDELEPTGQSRDRVFDCFEGIFKRVRQLLRIHDRLGYLQLVESNGGSINSLVEEQSDLVFDAVSAIQAALDGFTVMLATRAAIPWKRPTEIKNISFRNLNIGNNPWRNQFAKYQPVADICKEPVASLLEMALDLRRIGFHYHPLVGVGLSFHEWIMVQDQSGQTEPRSLREETAGAVRFGEAEWQADRVTHGIRRTDPDG